MKNLLLFSLLLGSGIAIGQIGVSFTPAISSVEKSNLAFNTGIFYEIKVWDSNFTIGFDAGITSEIQNSEYSEESGLIYPRKERVSMGFNGKGYFPHDNFDSYLGMGVGYLMPNNLRESIEGLISFDAGIRKDKWKTGLKFEYVPSIERVLIGISISYALTKRLQSP